MQPLIQPILSQIIDSCFYFPERFSDFSCWKYPQELQLLHLKTSYHLNRVFGQKFTRNVKNGFWMFTIINTESLWSWSRIGSRVKISHSIQPSNLSSALQNTLYAIYHRCRRFWREIELCLHCSVSLHTGTFCPKIPLKWWFHRHRYQKSWNISRQRIYF